jgi:3-hydroxyisobutyrate dehydrogenase-like beta-hydroxyacid dehydrogenase
MVTWDGHTPVIAVLGLGEAGSVIAHDLVAAGVPVRGYDPAVTAAEPIIDTASEAQAVRGAHLVLSVNSAKAAVGAFKAGLAGLSARHHEESARPDVLWADLNTASPGTKRQLAELAAEAGVPFADVAMMAPVPGRGLHVPMLASGTGAARYAAILGPLGADVEVLDGPAGLAASRKLLRSVFYKGMAASVVEALDAARAAGDEEWLRAHIAAELAAADAAIVDRITDGTRKHAVRRAAEMEAVADMLTELGVPPLMASASRALHERLAEGEARGKTGGGNALPERPERVALHLVPRGAQAEFQPPAGDDVHGRGHVGQYRRVPVDHAGHLAAHPDPPGGLGHRRQHRPGLQAGPGQVAGQRIEMIPVPGRLEQGYLVRRDPRVPDLFPRLMLGPCLDRESHSGDFLSCQVPTATS